MLSQYRGIVEDYIFDFQDDEYYYLYRHLPINEYSLRTISEQTVYLNSPSNFNDPFDCIAKVTEGYLYTKDKFREIYNKRMGRVVTDSELDHSYQTMIDTFTPQIRSGEFWRNMNKTVGATCFNHNPLNILMWSHYANNHKGFMIEFKFPKKITSSISGFIQTYIPMPVLYQNQFPIIDGNEGDEVVIKAFLIKAKCWEYEKEFRIIRNDIYDDAQRVVKIPVEFFCSVIKGPKFDKSHIDLFDNAINQLNLCSQSPITIYEAKLLDSEYQLTVPDHPRLDLSKVKGKE